MIKSIFYKEWLKTRHFCITGLAIILGFTVHSLFRIERVIDFQGISHIWEILLEKDTVLIEQLAFFPACFGLILALVQFMPEMAQKRLKLTLHLPFPHTGMIMSMTGYGIAILLGIYFLQAAAISAYFSRIIVSELTLRIMSSVLLWDICGLTVYLLTAWICLEPSWKRRAANILISAGLCRIFFLSQMPQAYIGMTGWLCLILLFALWTPVFSVWRFRQGVQD